MKKIVNKNLFSDKKFLLFSIILLGIFLKIYYVYQFDDYFDDWNFLYTVDPNISNEQTWKRYFGDRGEWFLPEDFPYYFAFTTKYFLKVVGYSVENAHFFLLFFSIGSFFIFIKLCRIFSDDYKFILIAILLLITNIFLTRELNSLRPHALSQFFCLTSLYYYILIYIKNKRSFKNNFLFILTTLYLLSIWPLNLAFFAGQCVYLLKVMIDDKKYKKNFLSTIMPLLLVAILYIIFNYKYLDYQVINKTQHYTNLDLKFFTNFFFRSFFGSILFGGIFLLIFGFFFLFEVLETAKKSRSNLILFIKNLKKENILLVIIITIYILIILYSIIRAGVMAPKYITILVPLIILWVSYKIYLLKNNFLYYSIIILTILNLIIYWKDIPIDRPETRKVLKEVVKSDIKNLYTTELIFFNNYLRNYKISIKNDVIVEKFIAKEVNNYPDQFWLLCMNNPRFALGENSLPDEKKCFKYQEANHLPFIKKELKMIKSIRYQDFILQLIEKS